MQEYRTLHAVALALLVGLIGCIGTKDVVKPPTDAAKPAAIKAKDRIIVTVVRVIDGDTVVVKRKDTGKEFKVRLWGIDAPEMNQPGGKEAKAWLVEFTKGIHLRYQHKSKDRYGRSVGVLFWDVDESRQEFGNEPLAYLLISQGDAWHYAKYAPKEKIYAEAQSMAKRGRLGLWKGDNPIPPWEWRKGRRK